jgi:predicted pyridoxine 5'-phosphate oxidase superfamily flavin-nucleotide-binding protein
MSSPPFHTDELTAQARAGVKSGGAGIRTFMPDQHRAFFATLPILYVSSLDVEGRPLASVLTGAAGFVHSPDPVTLRIDARHVANDPAAGTLEVGDEVGLLGLDLATRRRNRANGRVAAADGSGFTITLRQSFGNCPQYIQRRTICPGPSVSAPAKSLTSLDGDARKLVVEADTFFVASRSRSQIGDAGGADISHRGGQPGFVRVAANTLSIPDFRGNNYFNTLGNLLGDPRASLLFIGFETGDLLQLQGTAWIDWNNRAARQFEGAERLWHFEVTRGWLRRNAVPLRWSFVDYSPVTLQAGNWLSGSQECNGPAGW